MPILVHAVLLKTDMDPPATKILHGAVGTWALISGDATLGFSATFTAAAQVVVNHNLGRTPAAVTVRDTGGGIVEVEHRHLNDNQLLLVFDVQRAGSVEIL